MDMDHLRDQPVCSCSSSFRLHAMLRPTTRRTRTCLAPASPQHVVRPPVFTPCCAPPPAEQHVPPQHHVVRPPVPPEPALTRPVVQRAERLSDAVAVLLPAADGAQSCKQPTVGDAARVAGQPAVPVGRAVFK
eukprot:358612-Chlamydomonas_euryale.AAC.3